MKQTAVEWLEKELLKNGYVNKGYHNQDSLNHLENLFIQAKEMEKEQMMDCYLKADVFPRKYEFEEYYKETYGK